MPILSLLGRLVAAFIVATCLLLSLQTSASANFDGLLASHDFRPIGLRDIDSGSFHSRYESRAYIRTSKKDVRKGFATKGTASKNLARMTAIPKNVKPKKPISRPVPASTAPRLRQTRTARSFLKQLSTCPYEACFIANNIELNEKVFDNSAAVKKVPAPAAKDAKIKVDFRPVLLDSNKVNLLTIRSFDPRTIVRTMLPIESGVFDLAASQLIRKHGASQCWIETLDFYSIAAWTQTHVDRLKVARAQKPDNYWQYYDDCDHWKVNFASFAKKRPPMKQASFKTKVSLDAETNRMAMSAELAKQLPIVRRAKTLLENAGQAVKSVLQDSLLNQILKDLSTAWESNELNDLPPTIKRKLQDNITEMLPTERIYKQAQAESLDVLRANACLNPLR